MRPQRGRPLQLKNIVQRFQPIADQCPLRQQIQRLCGIAFASMRSFYHYAHVRDFLTRSAIKIDIAHEDAVLLAPKIGIKALRFRADPSAVPFRPFSPWKSDAARCAVVPFKGQIVAPVIGHGFGLAQEFFPIAQFFQRRNVKRQTHSSVSFHGW